MRYNDSSYHLKYEDVFHYQKHFFIVSQLFEKSLHDLIKDTTMHQFSTEFIKYTLFCLVSGVKDLHEKNAIHRNVTPSSVYLSEESALLGNMKDTVFLVKNRPKRSSQIGLHTYTAPEVYNDNQEYDFKVDIWSIGMTCLDMVRR